jgi:ribosome-associated toxin RatA of RatAB toxin-antitoxin module
MRRASLSLATLALLLVGGASSATADDAELEGGKVVVTSVPVAGSPEPAHVVRAIVESPPAAVWKVVSDCAHYKDRLPHVAASQELSRVGNTVTCQVTIAMPFPVSNLTAVTEAVHDERPEGMTRTWHLVSGDYDFNNGSWSVVPYRGGAASLVTYRVHVKPKTAVPDFVRNMAQEKALPDLIARVRVEAAKM